MSVSSVDTNDLHSTTSSKTTDVWDATREKADEVREAHAIATDMAEDGASKEEIHAELEQSLTLQGAVITVVVAGATAYAGINVMSSIADTMALSSGDMFYNSSQSLETGINDFFTNMPTVFVVIALVLIIGYLTLLR